MHRTALLAAVFLIGFGADYSLNRSERHHHEHEVCIAQNIGRKQFNVNSAHQRLLETAIVSSNEKAVVEIKTYHYPQSVVELKASPNAVQPLPFLPGCAHP